MPVFRSYDGCELAYHVSREGPPVLCLAGGPGRASAYLAEIADCLPGRTTGPSGYQGNR